MILLVDIGNTEVKIGVSKNNEILQKIRLATIASNSGDEYAIKIKSLLGNNDFEGVAISSVVPILTTKFVRMFESHFKLKPIVIGPGIKTGLKIKTDNPKEVGSDLIACAVAAKNIYGEDSLVIDLGTATKFIHTKDSTLDGVVIGTGVEVSARALTNSASLLPDFELKAPKKVLGTNTIECLQSGLIYGAAAMIDGMVYRIKKEVRNDNMKVIITGGLSRLVNENCYQEMVYDENLLLKGLEIIYESNK